MSLNKLIGKVFSRFNSFGSGRNNKANLPQSQYSFYISFDMWHNLETHTLLKFLLKTLDATG